MTEAEIIERVSAILAEAGFEPMPEGPLEGVYIKRGAIGYVFGGVHVGIGEVHAWEPGLSKRTTNDPVEAATKLAAYVRAKTPEPPADLTTEATLEPVVAESWPEPRGLMLENEPDPAPDMIPPRRVSFAETSQPEQDAAHDAEPAADLQPIAAEDSAGVERADAGDGGREPAAAEWLGEDETQTAGEEASLAEIDADFTEHTDANLLGLESPEPELPELEAPDLGAEILDEGQAEPPGSVAYFGDNIATIKLAKMGRLLEIAGVLERNILGDWSMEEFQAQQAQLERFARGELGAGTEAQAHFTRVAERVRAIEDVRRHMKGRSLVLQTGDRSVIEAFNPEEGWPGQVQ